MQQNNYRWRHRQIFTWKLIQMIWITQQDNFRQRTTICLKLFQKLLNVKSALSTAYHPQTDRTTEQINQEIKAYLSIYCTSHPEEWPTALHLLEFTHNNQWQADRQKTQLNSCSENPLLLYPLLSKTQSFLQLKTGWKHWSRIEKKP